MPASSILHVTDLHIYDPNSTAEHLRINYYDEYLGDLVKAIQKVEGPTVDAIIATGDFVDTGCVANFPHAKTVIFFLADQLGVPHDRVVVCPGNHDVIRDDDKAGNQVAARSAYAEFAQLTGNSSSSHRSLRGTFGKLIDNVWFLMLDSTLGAAGENRSGRMEAGEVDEIMSWVKTIPSTDILVIGSHHPVDTYISRSAAFDDPSGTWAQKHIWWDAAYLRERIKSERSAGFSVWLCGDIHRHGQFIEGGIAFCTAGRLGVTTSASHGEIRRQATVLQIEEPQRIAGIRFEYEMRGGRPEAHVGTWTSTPLVFTRIVEDIPEFTPSPRTVDTTTNVSLEVIDAELQKDLIAAISTHELYRFGRFVTGGDKVSLSWVSIGPLLGLGNNLAAVVTKMASWIESRVLEALGTPPQNVILLGTDCWGSVFASQISVMTGIRCFCTPVRGDGLYSAPEEALDSDLAEEIANAGAVVLVADVVASGRSLRRVADEILSAAKKPTTPKWFGLSLICDSVQDRGDALDILESHGTLCADLRMPLLSRDQLPSEQVLSPTLSFR